MYIIRQQPELRRHGAAATRSTTKVRNEVPHLTIIISYLITMELNLIVYIEYLYIFYVSMNYDDMAPPLRAVPDRSGIRK